MCLLALFSSVFSGQKHGTILRGNLPKALWTGNDAVSKSMPDDLLIRIASGEPAELQDVLMQDADINAFGASIDRTVLMSAAFVGRCSLIAALVENGASLELANKWGFTALHEAAAEGHATAVETLLRLGASMNVETSDGITPLMVAAAWGNCDVIRLLLSCGADVRHRDKRGSSALMIAEEKGENDAAGILRDAEAII